MNTARKFKRTLAINDLVVLNHQLDAAVFRVVSIDGFRIGVIDRTLEDKHPKLSVQYTDRSLILTPTIGQLKQLTEAAQPLEALTRFYIYSLKHNAWRNWRGEWVKFFQSAEDSMSRGTMTEKLAACAEADCAVIFALLVTPL